MENGNLFVSGELHIYVIMIQVMKNTTMSEQFKIDEQSRRNRVTIDTPKYT